ncbi:MAG: hypothetical protein IJO70_01270 [Lachnospiraceae bacterium]|nr:hypothetical protein [Lachnospiraceae bacterium]
MGLKDLFKKKEENTTVTEVERKSIFDTDYPMDKSNWKHVFSACLGQSVVTQDAMAELVVKDRNWFVDFSKGTLTFGNDAYPVQFIGSESSHSDTWMWGWNNINGFDESIIKLAREVCDIGEDFNLEPLITKTFPLTDELYGHTLAIVACGVSKGKYCYYRGPHDGGAIMMAVSGLPQEVFTPIDMQRFISTTMECIQQFELDHKIFVESLLMWNGTAYECTGNKVVAHFAQDLMITFEQVGDIVRITDIKTV